MWIMTKYRFFHTHDRDIKLMKGMLCLESEEDDDGGWIILIKIGVEEDLRNKILLALLSNKRVIDIRDYEREENKLNLEITSTGENKRVIDISDYECPGNTD